MSKCPYNSLPDYSFWRRSVSRRVPDVDPVASVKFTVSKTDKVVTAGSCFAQHIARYLKSSGFNYYVPETISDLVSPQVSRLNGYDLFSARYGNVYTARQLVQLFDRAYGQFTPVEDEWAAVDGWLDPFRPFVEKDGFRSREELVRDRRAHFEAVKSCFEKADVFIFTLGLTETWMSREDGAVFPVCPGCGAGEFNPNKYVFKNFNVEEVVADINGFIDRVRSVNEDVKIILTVSPVPLVATMEDRSVVVSTTYSKSVLRVAAQQILDQHACVDYFPSYEMITAGYAAGTAFGDDWREVREDAVSRVMRVFLKHYCNIISGQDVPSPPARVKTPRAEKVADAICDEENLDRNFN